MWPIWPPSLPRIATAKYASRPWRTVTVSSGKRAQTPAGMFTRSSPMMSWHGVPAQSNSSPSRSSTPPRSVTASTRDRAGESPSSSATKATSASNASARWRVSERKNASPVTVAVPAAIARSTSRPAADESERSASCGRNADRRRWYPRRGMSSVPLPLLSLDQNYLGGIAKRKPAFVELEEALRAAVAAGAVGVVESPVHRRESAPRPDLRLLELLRELSHGRRLPASGAESRQARRRGAELFTGRRADVMRLTERLRELAARGAAR